MTPALDMVAAALLQEANSLAAEGKSEAAVACFLTIISRKPDFVEAQYNLGNTYLSCGRWNDAAVAFRAAIELKPTLTAAHSNLGHALRNLGQLEQAEACFRRVVALDPGCATTYSNLGSLLMQQGKLDEAINFFRQALNLNPTHFESHHNLGGVFYHQGKRDKAIASFRRALELNPQSAATLCNLGVALQHEGQVDAAITTYRQALDLERNFPEVYCNLADALKRRQRFDEALSCCRRALELKPDYYEACSNLADILTLQGNFEAAVRFYEWALRLRPDSVEAKINVGNALKEQGQLTRATEYYRQALEQDSQSAAAYCNLGVAWLGQAEIEQALACFRSALRIRPIYPLAHSNLLYSLLYSAKISPATLLEEHRAFDRLYSEPLETPGALHINVPNLQKRLRLGFVSADFGRHPVGFFLIGLVENLPRHLFETFCYSDRIQQDGYTHRIRSAVGCWRETADLDDDRLRQQIQTDRIDVLFDLAGHTSKNRLPVFARKSAPIQVTWAGYAGTTGLKSMDYILADRYEVPIGAEHYYQERVWRMPNGYVCYTPPEYAPVVDPLPALRNKYITFGCFNNPAKVSQSVIDVWARILQRMPDARLILKYRGWNDPAIAKRFLEKFPIQIDPDRITFHGQSSHVELLSEYNQTDIALDTFPYSGGLTTCEAMWMGVPVITFPGETFASRHSFSHLSNVGLTETIGRNVDEYVELAIALGEDWPRLASLRAGLRERMARSPLCDSKLFAANMTAALHEIWNRAISGQVIVNS